MPHGIKSHDYHDVQVISIKILIISYHGTYIQDKTLHIFCEHYKITIDLVKLRIKASKPFDHF